MKIKNLTQKGKYVLVASILGMATVSSFATSTGTVGTALAVTQQTAKIKGTILDAKNGEPIIGANVLVKGTTNGTITDFDGNYEHFNDLILDIAEESEGMKWEIKKYKNNKDVTVLEVEGEV